NYMMGVDSVCKIHNGRGNPQNRYYPDEETDQIIQKIWRRLRRDNNMLFPSETEIRNSAIFKASPLHTLTEDQKQIKDSIISRINDVIKSDKDNQLIFIEGEAGTGKTVLNSCLFYELITGSEFDDTPHLNCYMMVNHDEQVNVYEQIANKLGIIERYGNVVTKPTSFINNHTKDNPVDVVFVDEAHLLLTQGKQAYRGKNQLHDIIERSRVTIVMYDPNQVLTAEQYWEAEEINRYREKSKQQQNYYLLTNQLRIRASKEVVDWINDFTINCEINSIPSAKGGYDIKIFDSPEALDKAITSKSKDKDHSLSRLIASYDWEYSNKAKSRLSKYWEVCIGSWHKPWNRELNGEISKDLKKQNKSLAWAEQQQTIGEVGSTFTIQGFDLNYAGVILGPSVKYRNGRIIFDPSESFNHKAVQKRTLSDGSKQSFGEMLIQHEVRVLMTRGVEGLYIYACDDELREALMCAVN
ncbi:MAG: DUF2075 domain-containing protein, partial [Clostridiales bacterium]|nr:DUF2075 domain-containing protein [Clostridiales bacterium]